MSNSKSNKSTYITILSIISCFAVVFLHVNCVFWDFNYGSMWFSANVIERVCYFGVPIFFMITGANLIDYPKKYSTLEYFKKRFSKTVVPFIFWSLFGVFFYLWYMKSFTVNELSIPFIVIGIFNNSFNEIYWFFWPLFSIYLCIPLFASIDEKKRQFALSYIVIVAFILTSLVPFIFNLFKIETPLPIESLACAGLLIYPILGYLLSHYEIGDKKRLILYMLGGVSFIVQLFGTYYYSLHIGKFTSLFTGYLSPFTIIYAAAIFVFIKEVYKKRKLSNRKMTIIDFLSKHTFAIYLIHFYLIKVFAISFKADQYSLLYRLTAPFLIIAICIIISMIIKKIPFVKKVLP